jgi:hypothetical protein
MAHPILEAQDALKAVLTARAAWAEVNVRDGGPTEGEDITSDAFWFNDTTVPRDGWASLGAQRRRITFLLGFTIAVRRYGDDERTARANALTYFEDLCLAVKANSNLSGSVRQADDVTGTVGSAPVAPQQWGAWFTGTLSVTSKDY